MGQLFLDYMKEITKKEKLLRTLEAEQAKDRNQNRQTYATMIRERLEKEKAIKASRAAEDNIKILEDKYSLQWAWYDN